MTVDFVGPTATSDRGLLLLKQTEMKLNLLSRLALCFRDRSVSPKLCTRR